MHRPKRTPRTWYSEDGNTMYRMDEYGLIDIIPVRTLNALIARTERYLTAPKPYARGSEHVHWAYKTD